MITDKATLILKASLEATAKAHHAAHLGKILLCREVTGYNDKDDSVDVICDPPARMRVCSAMAGDLEHWNDNWLDPYWDVTPVEPHPALDGIRSLWVFGTSYCTDGSIKPTTTWEVERTTSVQRLRDSGRFLAKRWRL